ncbi:MAG: NADH-quinone oxidoreductase subunit M, partial [Rhizobiaceae bacterium]|nr:NADH-quinone oxidoreductase subunit M [Rhizobiaceae bacterium]
MTDWPLLSVVTFIPLVCVLFLLPIKDDTEIGRRNIRQVALLGTTATFIMSLLIWANFDASDPGFQMVETIELAGSGFSYAMGVDGISMLFVILTTFLMPLCILASWNSIETRVLEYMIAFLVLETMMIGV